MSRKNSLKLAVLLSTTLMCFSSCLTLPSLHRTAQTQTNEISINNTSQIEALKREDYNVLRTTTGSASTTTIRILFFPIGKYKTNSELYENAYADAIDNLPNADALILPRQQTKKLTIPLILVNYSTRKVTVTGVGISVKNKVMENMDSDVPFVTAKNYSIKNSFKNKQSGSSVITNQMEFDRIFEMQASADADQKPLKIDFSKQYVIAIIDKASRNKAVMYANELKLQSNEMTLYYKKEEGEKQTDKTQPFLLLVVDKKYQGNLKIKRRT
jgi:hypothetical protein